MFLFICLFYYYYFFLNQIYIWNRPGNPKHAVTHVKIKNLDWLRIWEEQRFPPRGCPSVTPPVSFRGTTVPSAQPEIHRVLLTRCACGDTDKLAVNTSKVQARLWQCWGVGYCYNTSSFPFWGKKKKKKVIASHRGPQLFLCCLAPGPPALALVPFPLFAFGCSWPSSGLRDEVAGSGESDWASLGQGARSEWLQCCPCPCPSWGQHPAPGWQDLGDCFLWLFFFSFFFLKWKRLYFIFFNPTNDFKMGVPVPFLCTRAGVDGPLIPSRLRVWPGWLTLRHLTIPRGNFLSHDWQSKRWGQAF